MKFTLATTLALLAAVGTVSAHPTRRPSQLGPTNIGFHNSNNGEFSEEHRRHSNPEMSSQSGFVEIPYRGDDALNAWGVQQLAGSTSLFRTGSLPNTPAYVIGQDVQFDDSESRPVVDMEREQRYAHAFQHIHDTPITDDDATEVATEVDPAEMHRGEILEIPYDDFTIVEFWDAELEELFDQQSGSDHYDGGDEDEDDKEDGDEFYEEESPDFEEYDEEAEGNSEEVQYGSTQNTNAYYEEAAPQASHQDVDRAYNAAVELNEAWDKYNAGQEEDQYQSLEEPYEYVNGASNMGDIEAAEMRFQQYIDSLTATQDTTPQVDPLSYQNYEQTLQAQQENYIDLPRHLIQLSNHFNPQELAGEPASYSDQEVAHVLEQDLSYPLGSAQQNNYAAAEEFYSEPNNDQTVPNYQDDSGSYFAQAEAPNWANDAYNKAEKESILNHPEFVSASLDDKIKYLKVAKFLQDTSIDYSSYASKRGQFVNFHSGIEIPDTDVRRSNRPSIGSGAQSEIDNIFDTYPEAINEAEADYVNTEGNYGNNYKNPRLNEIVEDEDVDVLSDSISNLLNFGNAAY